MAAAQPDSDLVHVCTDATEGGTLVRVVAPSRQIRMVDLMPVFEALDLNLVSYTAERDPDAIASGAMQVPLARRKHSFRGRFLVTDADGHNLSDAMLDELVAALQEALHVRLSRLGRCANLLQEDSRRGSVASYATDASVDPDSPSFATAVAAAPASVLHGYASVGGSLSQVSHSSHSASQPSGSQQQQQQVFYSSAHSHTYPHPHPQPYQTPDSQPHQQQQQQQDYRQQQQQHDNQQCSLPYQPHAHHEHAPSAGSMLLSEHSMSSASSLFRVASGAASDPQTVPSPPSNARLDNQACLQQQADPGFLDTGAQGSSNAAAASTTGVNDGGNGMLPYEERYSSGAAPATPFYTGTYHQQFSSQHQHHHHYHYQHTRSQPVPSARFHSGDAYELSQGLPQRISSASSSTPPNISGTLPTIHATAAGPLPEAWGQALVAAAAATAPSAGAAVAAGGSARAAIGTHVSFLEPLPYSLSVTAAPKAGTQLHSCPPSSSTPRCAAAAQISGSSSQPLPLISLSSSMAVSGVMQAEVAAAAAAAISAAASGGCGSAQQQQQQHISGDASPTSSSSDERDGSFTWWSTFSAQDSVARIMSHPARSISAEADLGQAKSLMTKHNISALLVNTGNALPGFITKRDFLKVQFSKNFKRTRVKDVMTQPVIFVDISLPIEQCSRVLEAHGVRRVLVHDPSRTSEDDPLSCFVGVVSDADLFKCMGAPAMSPGLGSMANSTEHAQPIFGMLPGGDGSALPPLPLLPPLGMPVAPAPVIPHPQPQSQPHAQAQAQPTVHAEAQAQPTSLPQPAQPTPHAQAQAQPTPQPTSAQPLPGAVSTAGSSASVSVAGSAGPSHAASVATGLHSVDTVNAAVAAALALTGGVGSLALTGGVGSLALTGGVGSLALTGGVGSRSAAMRLNAEASLAERYRCAAALWELDFNELEVTRRIGEGSFGEVLLANFRGTKVAVKRLRGFDVGPDNPDTGGPGETGPSPTQMPIFRQFFEREIEILATIRHPNVVNFIGACHTPPNVCLVTEYCARGSLDHLLHKSSIPLDLLKKVEFSMDIARGMSCLHSQKPPIIHRDLKTANLLVSARFEVKVADFGLSRIKDHAQLINSRAGLEGTVEYAAPEVLRGEPYTEKCDIWSYAVLLWEIIHRQRPYADADVPIYILMMSLGNGSLRLPPVREELATSGLARLVERCMAWHPADRPSFREVLHALEAEYKILRGKASAVPRSDSASSMMVLPGGQIRGLGAADAATHHNPHHAHNPHGGAAIAAAGAGAATPGPIGAGAGRPMPQTPPPAAAGINKGAAVPQRKSSKLGLNPHTPRAEPGGARGEGSHAHAHGMGPMGGGQPNGGVQHFPVALPGPHPQSQNPQQSGRPRVKLTVPVQGGPPLQNSDGHGGDHDGQQQDPMSPADSSSRPSSSRNATSSTAGRGGGGTAATGGSGKPSSAGRPSGRSLRSAARSKSMPLPEFAWLGGEDESEEYMDTTESMADEDADAAASSATSTSGAIAAAAAVAPSPHPLTLLSADRSGVRASPYAVAMGREASTDEPHLEVIDVAAGVDADVGSPLPHHLVVRVTLPGEVKGAEDGAAAVGPPPSSPRSQQQLVSSAQEAGPCAPLWRGDRALDATPVSPLIVAAVSRQSPFQMASSSPFADAADIPWSPRGSDEAGSSPSCFSSHIMSDSAAVSATQLPQHQPQQAPLSAKPAACAAAAAGAPLVTPPPPRRAAFVSPFAQLANEVPPSPRRSEDGGGAEEECGEDGRRRCAAEGMAEGQGEDERRRWRHLTASSGGAAAMATPPARTVAAASTANSTDVHLTGEKDQRMPVEASWGVLGTCSKPPSGDVYTPAVAAGAAGRLSPRAGTPPGVPSLASPYDAGADTVRVAEDGRQQSVAMADAESAEEAADGGERGQRLVAALSSASAGMEALELPGVLAFGAAGLAGARSGSSGDQFEDEEDAALHTTAWVRL